MRQHGISLVLAAAVLILPAAKARTIEPPAAQQGTERSLRDRNWLEDLRTLEAELPKRHVDAFSKCSKEVWGQRLEEISGSIVDMSDERAVVEARRLVAMIGDGHTVAYLDKDSAIPAFRMYGIACAWLKDGIFAAVLPKEHEAMIGQRLVKVGGRPIEEVVEKLASVQASDNESGRKNQTMATLREAETLAALGIIADIDKSEFTLADRDGKETTLVLGPLPRGSNQAQMLAQKPDPSALGTSRRAQRAAYGREVLADGGTLYVWYDTCANVGPKTVAEFCAETLAALDEALKAEPPNIGRVVIDLRRNGGGDSSLFAPMIDGLAHRAEINQTGRLFALIGRRTFSSAMMNAYQLRSATKCQLVGEPTGGTPNGFGEIKNFRLPNSKVLVQYSTKRFKGPRKGDAVMPDIAVEPTSAEYFDGGRDVVLEAATGK